MTHICVGKLTIFDSDNGLSPGRRQAIIWTNAGILLIGPLGTNFNGILIGIQTFSFKKMHLKMSSAKWRPFCLSLNVLKYSLWTAWWKLNSRILDFAGGIRCNAITIYPLRVNDTFACWLSMNTEAEAIWPLFCRRHIQLHFLIWKHLNYQRELIEICYLGSS